MTIKDDVQKSAATKKRKTPASQQPQSGNVQEANGRLTGKQALALWELVIKGDGTVASKRSVKLDQSEVKGLESAGLVTVQNGPQKLKPTHGAKTYVTDAGWAWANHQGFAARLSRTPVAASVLEALLDKVGAYLKVHDLALDHLLRPRRDDPEPSEAATPVSEERSRSVSGEVASPAALEERIRAAYLRVTKGALNEYVKLALLRAELRGEAVELVDAELRAMQQRGGAVLYPIDDPQRLRPEDEAAALRISGERRDLLCIMR